LQFIPLSFLLLFIVDYFFLPSKDNTLARLEYLYQFYYLHISKSYKQ